MRKALVVIDMQNDFIDGALGSPQAQAIVPNVVEKIKAYQKSGDAIIFTRDTHQQNYLQTQEGQNLPVPHCIEGTPGWHIADAIASSVHLPSCPIFDKGGFGSLELAQYLRQENYDEIELVGLVSSICVISNALLIKAHLPETKILVDAACTAGVTDEDYTASLCVMKMCHIHLLNA
ncbi:MAG: cysteine hydrolase [Proteobacteria bacterium]|nr:cysteine hydrolase [Pseudomonadota bacterium]MCL2307956.1 cysteine hydrolase [Pseudomonadota bacterium]